MPAKSKQSDVALLGLAETSELVHAKKLSPVELTQACLARIEALNPELNAFITVTAEMALAQARAAEAEIQRSAWRGPLHGIPVSLKDLIDVAGVPTTAASKVFEDRVPTEDAEVVQRLKAAGAVIVGKNNLHECAYGGSGVISRYGPAKNPRYPGRITAGSSSGSAAAVAGGLCYGAIVTDTAGSIRLPAAFCGIVGFKPTYGLVSARGVMPLSWSLDHIGPMARSVTDVALILAAIAGYDPADPTSREIAAADYAAAVRTPAPKLRVGVPRKLFYEDLDSDVARVAEGALRVVAGLAAETREVCVPMDNDRTVSKAETYAYHAQNVRERADQYDPETLRRINTGADVSVRDYLARLHELELARRSAAEIFKDVDVVVTPTAPVPPPLLAELQADMSRLRERELLMLRNTRPFNVLGLPGISVPCGETSAGLPVALQIAGPAGKDAQVLAFARGFEEKADSSHALSRRAPSRGSE
ncbi:MAG TPA: amidase [Rhizomicrobium sp.]|nr:amidase [Rhizomicrobium sp.]